MKHPIRVSRGHMGDLEAAALNCGNKELQEKFEQMKIDPGFEIVDQPQPGEFLQDLSIMFMYPSPPPTNKNPLDFGNMRWNPENISVLDFKNPPPILKPRSKK